MPVPETLAEAAHAVRDLSPAEVGRRRLAARRKWEARARELRPTWEDPHFSRSALYFPTVLLARPIRTGR